MMMSKRSAWLFSTLFVLALLVVFVLTTRPAAVAQNNPDSTGQFLTELWDRVTTQQTGATSSSFVFTINFNQSLSGIGGTVTLGQNLNSLQISRIGQDYFCLSRAFSRTSNIDCVPFANIKSISYQEAAR